jgi:hypothetical protein
MDNFIFIHVGKCSGSVLEKNFNKLKHISIHYANQRPPLPSIEINKLTKIHSMDKFICCVRHPVDRWISAFNFKYTRVILRNGNDRLAKEKEGFEFYKTATNLAEQLYNEDGTPNAKAHIFATLQCDHLAFGLEHYLGNFDESHTVKVICHEFIKRDFEKVFKKKIVFPKSSVRPNSKPHDTITLKAYKNIKKFIKKDFDTIDKFASYNFISKEYQDMCHGLPISTTIKN